MSIIILLLVITNKTHSYYTILYTHQRANRLFMRTIKVKFETLIIIGVHTNYYLNSIIFMFFTDHFISILYIEYYYIDSYS